MPVWKVPQNLTEMLRMSLANPDITGWIPDDPGPVLNIGCGEKHIVGATHLDLPEWDADKQGIPFSDSHFQTIYALHFLEHIQDPIRQLREMQRVLKPGGHLNVAVPYYSTQGAFHDLDHKSFWCEETWRHTFNNPYYAKDHDGWNFTVGANFIIGILERNVLLISQLIKDENES
jgi:SAM-dependent methyltransferase